MIHGPSGLPKRWYRVRDHPNPSLRGSCSIYQIKMQSTYNQIIRRFVARHKLGIQMIYFKYDSDLSPCSGDPRFFICKKTDPVLKLPKLRVSGICEAMMRIWKAIGIGLMVLSWWCPSSTWCETQHRWSETVYGEIEQKILLEKLKATKMHRIWS